MSDTELLVSRFSRYAKLIEAQIRSAPFEPRSENANALQVERGIVLAGALTDPQSASTQSVDRLVELSRSDRLGTIAVIDAGGHHRPVYRPLLVYAWLVAFKLRYESLSQSEFGHWDESLRAWSDLLEAELGRIDLPDTGVAASRGASVCEAAWSALALFVAGKVFVRDAWTDLASDTFGRLTRGQQSSGAYLHATASDNPETLWYHELCLLHACASYACQAEDRTVAKGVLLSANDLVQNVQPDHASSHPFGVFAFVWAGDSTVSMADQLIHAASMKSPMDGVSLVLLSDALYCLRLFL